MGVETQFSFHVYIDNNKRLNINIDLESTISNIFNEEEENQIQ